MVAKLPWTRSTPANTDDVTIRGALGSAWFAFFVDIFDIYLPVIALAPAAAYFLATDIDPKTAATISAVIFVSTIVGRPIGAFLFGHFADRIGRRRVALISVTGFGVVTLVIGLLPGYRQIGLAAPILLVTLRFVDGIFLGGEYTAVTPLVLENAPVHRRGLYGGIIACAYPAGYFAISLLTFLILQVVPESGVDSPYTQWGWRIPFYLGGLLALGLAWWIRRHIGESRAWENADKPRSPVRTLFSGESGRNFVQVFLLMNGLWLTSYMASAVLPAMLKSPVALSATQITGALVIANIVCTGSYVASGMLSQRIGRRRTLIISSVLLMTVTPALYAVMVSGRLGFWAIVVLCTLILVLAGVPYGMIGTYINERFSTEVRASGFGLGYSLGFVIPALYPFYQAGLSHVVDIRYTGPILMAIGAVVALIGAVRGPETRDVVMAPRTQR